MVLKAQMQKPCSCLARDAKALGVAAVLVGVGQEVPAEGELHAECVELKSQTQLPFSGAPRMLQLPSP